MSSFVVSARKYRPSRFSDVVGQDHITLTLKNAIRSNQLAHSFLFCGPRGVGKTTCARILAKTINCLNLTDEIEACNTCESCVAFNENASFNVHELDAASNNSVEDIRSLTENVRFVPQAGKYKIYIIDEVHMLSAAAFNAFLKTLEEPPAHAKFILATTEKNKIIPTILSRCQIFDFKRIPVDFISSHLEAICKQEAIESDKNALNIIAQKADGGLRDALSLFDRLVTFSGKKLSYQDVISNLNMLDYDYYFKATEFILSSDTSSLLNLFNEVLKNGFEGDDFLQGLASHFRDVFVLLDPQTSHLVELSGELRDKYLNQASLVTPDLLVNALKVLNETDNQYRFSRNKRLLAEYTLIKLCNLSSFLLIDFHSENVESKKKITTAEPTPEITETAGEKLTVKEEKMATENIVDEAVLTNTIEATSSKPKIKLDLGGVKLSAYSDMESRVKEQEDVRLKQLEQENSQPIDIELSQFNTVYREMMEADERAGRKDKAHLFNSIIPEIKNHIIVFKCSSDVQKGLLLEFKSELLEYFKTHLKNPSIQIEAETDESRMILIPTASSPKELLLKMVEKNPAIGELITKLNLELDY